MACRGIWLWIASLVVVAAPVAAQDAYPNRPVRWIVPFAAGGPTDTLSRIFAAKLGEQWGQSVVVENKGGASGAIGSDFAAKSAPDGYTLILGTQSTHGSNLIFFPNLPYDPIKDFQPLALIGTACMALVTAPSVPANTPKELVEWIRKQDGGVNYASAAPGSSQHVAAELLVKRAGIKATHVPYRGSSAAMPDLMSGRVTFMFDNLPSALPQAKTPRPIVDKLSADINRALKAPDSMERWKNLGFDPIGSTPEQFAERQKADLDYWKRMIEYTGIKVE